MLLPATIFWSFLLALRSSAVIWFQPQFSSVSSEHLLRSSAVNLFALQVRYLSELPL